MAAGREEGAVSVDAERPPATELANYQFGSAEADFGAWWGLVVVLGDIAERLACEHRKEDEPAELGGE